MSDINLGQIENDKTYDFKSKYDEDEEVFVDNSHSCEYFEMDEFKNKFTKNINCFSIYSHNIRSINGHWDDFLDILNSAQPFKYSVIGLQEVWSVNKNYEIPGYGKFEFITRDMNKTPNPNCGGGVGLFIDKKYKNYEILTEESVFEPNVYESIWVKIKMKSGHDKIIGNVYRPNSAPKANLEKALQIHNQIIDNILRNKNHAKCEIQILSDFNVNMLNFETHGPTNDYINSLISRSFLPLITLPTRIKNQSATLIDHIWSNKVCHVYNSGILINSLSDHFPVFYIEEDRHRKIKLPEIHTRNINSTTIPSFCKLLKSASWTNILNENNPDKAFKNFFETFYSARDISFPEVKVKKKSVKFVHSPWMSSGLKISQKRKEKLFSRKVKSPSSQNINNFKAYNKLYNKLRRAAKIQYFDKQFKTFAKNSKQTWSVIREVLGTKKQKDQIPDFFRQNGQFISEYLDIANGFNTFFTGIGPKLASEIGESNISFDTFLSEENPNSFEFSRISEIDILYICKQLKPKISSGADFISNKLLKEIAPIIIAPLHHLINLSLESGFVPHEFKISKVVPVFKSRDSHDFNN